MNSSPTQDELITQRLADLEAGLPLETCLAGLPEDAAQLVQLAAQLRTLPGPQRNPQLVAAQRAKFITTAKEKQRMSKSFQPPKGLFSFALLGGLATVLVVVCLAGVLLVSGAVWLRPQAQNPVVSQNTSNNSSSSNGVKAINAESAILTNVRGNVEIKSGSDEWTHAQDGQTVKAGQNIRTGALSSVMLVLYDGSQARLGPDAELALDHLDARTSGPRVVQLTQLKGESHHIVAKSSDAGSSYVVNTPSGSGSAKGTEFTVLVLPTLSEFWVDEGAVSVVSVNVTVLVVAGQITLIPVGQPPAEPVFRVMGEGEVAQTGTVWKIAGQTFATNANTLIYGDPQVGDWVSVEGHLFPDGSRFADKIILLRRSVENRFSFTGKVESISAQTWVISGRTVKVDATTTLEDGLAVGDLVQVTGGVARDGVFWATSINQLEAQDQAFHFTGAVESVGDPQWTVSGIQVTVNQSTTVNGDFVAGDLVVVEGKILEDGTWLATSIEPSPTQANRFEFTGVVQGLAPWQVAGIAFDTNDQTEIDEAIKVGDRVVVAGVIRPDGSWLAERIERLDAEHLLRFNFFGPVQSVNPWVVRGVPLTIDANTLIKGEISVGEMVKVEGWILEDGTWLATEIKHTGLHLGQGCLRASTVARSLAANRLVLFDGRSLDLTQAEIQGDIKEASVVLYQLCVGPTGQIIIVQVIVIYQLDALPVVIIQPNSNPNPNNCQDGPDHDQGRGNDCHKKDKDD